MTSSSQKIENESAKTKYPRTPHLPWSPGASPDDDLLMDTRHFAGLEVVVTEKMDGENTTLYRDGLHARSLETRPHASRDWVKGLWGRIRFELPDGWRLCGENLYARHSLEYPELEGYFYLFSVWNEQNQALSWEDTLEWARLLELPTPRTLYQGIWNERVVGALEVDTTRMEGYVVRLASSFTFPEFKHSLAKWVRPNHVQTGEHWMHQAIVANGLKGKGS
jgi:hypothetical protein